MNEHRTEYLRRKEIQERQEKMLAEKREVARIKRQTGLMAAGIMCITGMIMVVAPVRFHAIAGDNLTPEQQYLAANANEGVINAPSILEARLATTQGEPVTELAESLMSKGEEDFVPVQEDVLVTADVVDSSIAASEGVTSLAAYDDAPASAIEQASRGEMTLRIPLYESATPSLYQTAVLDVAQLHDIGEIADTMLSVGDVPVQEGDGVIYDGETGILYIPKGLATGENSLQARLLLNVKPEATSQEASYINTAHIEEAGNAPDGAGGSAISEDGSVSPVTTVRPVTTSHTDSYTGCYGRWLLPNGKVVQATAASACLLGYVDMESEEQQEEIVEELPAEESPAEESYAEVDVAPEDPLDNKNLSTQGNPIDESGNILSNDDVVVDDDEVVYDDEPEPDPQFEGVPIDEGGALAVPSDEESELAEKSEPENVPNGGTTSLGTDSKGTTPAGNSSLKPLKGDSQPSNSDTKGGLGIDEGGHISAGVASSDDSTLHVNVTINGNQSYRADLSKYAFDMMCNAHVDPQSATVLYASDNEKAARIDENGILTVFGANNTSEITSRWSKDTITPELTVTFTIMSNKNAFSPIKKTMIFHIGYSLTLGVSISPDNTITDSANSAPEATTTTDSSFAKPENPKTVADIIPIDVSEFSRINVKDILRYPIFLIADPTGYKMTDDIPGMSFANSLFSKGLGLACPGTTDLQIARNVTTLRQWGITSLPTTRNGVATNVSVEEALVRDFLNNGFKIVTYDTNNKAKTIDIVKDVYDAGLIFVYEAGAIDQLPNSIAVELNKYQNFGSIADLIKVFLMIRESEWNPDVTTTNETSTTGSNSETPMPVDSDAIVGTGQADTNKTDESSSPSSDVPIGTQVCLASTAPMSGAVRYVSSNDAVASVDAKGLLTAHALGDAVITITITNGDGSVVKQEMPIHVIKRTPTLVMPNKTVTMGNTALMCAEASNGANVTYKAADPSVITVDSNTGKVMPLKVGTSLVTATIESSDVWEGATAQSTVTVKAGTPDINAEDIEIKPGATTSLNDSESENALAQNTSTQGASTPAAPAVTTPAPAEPAVTTPAPAAPAVTTPAPAAPAVTTPAPAAPAVTTPALAAPAVTAPAPAEPALTTHAPAAPALTYSSSDPSVATVSDDGTVTAQKVGTTTITITSAASDDWQAAQKEVTVTVTENPSDKTPSSEGEGSNDESGSKATGVVSAGGLGDAKTDDSGSKPTRVRTTSGESSAKEKAGMITREVGSLVQTGDPIVLVTSIALIAGSGAYAVLRVRRAKA